MMVSRDTHEMLRDKVLGGSLVLGLWVIWLERTQWSLTGPGCPYRPYRPFRHSPNPVNTCQGAGSHFYGATLVVVVFLYRI